MSFAMKLSLILTLNFLRISLSLHVAYRVNKKFENTSKSVNLFADDKRGKNICMKHICITKYMHGFTINKTCIFHHGCGKYSNLWCSSKWKMDLQVKKMKVRHSDKAKTLSPVSIITPKAKTNYSFPQLKGRTMKTYFQMNCFKPTFLKHLTEECTFC